MATQVQYDVFRAAAHEESERYLGRESQAKLCLAIIIAYFDAAAFKTTQFLRSVS